MAGIYGTHPVDRYWESQLDNYIDQTSRTTDEPFETLSEQEQVEPEPDIVTISIDLYNDLEEFLDERSDADFDGERFIPNKAMQLLSQLKRSLK